MVQIFNLTGRGSPSIPGRWVCFLPFCLTSSNHPLFLPNLKKKTKIANDFPHKFPNASPPYPPPPLVKTEQNTPCHFLKAFFYYYLDWHLSVGLVCPAHQYRSSRFHPPFRYKLYSTANWFGREVCHKLHHRLGQLNVSTLL